MFRRQGENHEETDSGNHYFLCHACGCSSVYAIHEQKPAEYSPVEGKGTTPVVSRGASADATTLQALINLLEKKGLITTEELRKETDRLKSRR